MRKEGWLGIGFKWKNERKVLPADCRMARFSGSIEPALSPTKMVWCVREGSCTRKKKNGGQCERQREREMVRVCDRIRVYERVVYTRRFVYKCALI